MFKTNIVTINAVCPLYLKRTFHLCLSVFFLPNHTFKATELQFRQSRLHKKRFPVFIYKFEQKLMKKRERSSLLAYYSNEKDLTIITWFSPFFTLNAITCCLKLRSVSLNLRNYHFQLIRA